MPKFDLVIFDMDGTLVDTEPMAAQAMALCLKEQFGKDVDAQMLADKYRGAHIDVLLDDMSDHCGVPLTRDFLAVVDAMYHGLIDTDLRATVGASNLFSTLDKACQMSIASNSSREILEHYISALSWTDRFAMNTNVFSADDVNNGKPAPDLFLLAAERMQVDPGRCIVLEDSAPGAEAAVAAGMAVVGFVGNHPESRVTFDAHGIEVIDDLTRFASVALQ